MKPERYVEYKATGKCPNCGRPTQEFTYCDDCRSKIRKKQQAVEKRCVDCNAVMPYTGYFRGKRCKACAEKADKLAVDNWYKNLSPERKSKKRKQLAEYAREWRKNHPEQSASNWLKKQYGITFSDFKSIYEEQQGKCAMCFCSLPTNLLDSQERKKIHVDHDHKTGKVRGILCPRCNMGIGIFNDSIDTLKLAIAYLEKSL